jgi:GxxExxY protein
MSEKIIYPELSFKIVGILFEVYNELGGSYQEKYYQRAIAAALNKNKVVFKEQFPIELKFQEEKIGKYYLDFIIEGKIVLEIKKGNYYSRTNIQQVYCYLKSSGSKLGILANFTPSGVKFKRIVNIN